MGAPSSPEMPLLVVLAAVLLWAPGVGAGPTRASKFQGLITNASSGRQARIFARGSVLQTTPGNRTLDGEQREQLKERPGRAGFEIPKHKDAVQAPCDSSDFLKGPEGEQLNKQAGEVIGKGWRKAMCEAVSDGAAWPDCPNVPEEDALGNGCLWGKFPTDRGAREMVFQAMRAMFWDFGRWIVGLFRTEGPGLTVHEISAYRSSMQHEHGSPLPPLHRDNGKTPLALTTMGELRGKMLQQALIWQCKGGKHLVKSKNEDEFRIGALFYGKILHMLQDTFSLSHSERHWDSYWGPEFDKGFAFDPATHQKGMEILRQAAIVKAYSMDDVDWMKHRIYDDPLNVKGDAREEAKIMYALAQHVSLEVLTILTRFMGRVLSTKNVTAAESNASQEMTDFICDYALTLKDPESGAGGSSLRVGRNWGRSSWIAGIPANDEERKLVKERREELLRDIDAQRVDGVLPHDKRIKWVYPEDLCQGDRRLRCADVLKFQSSARRRRLEPWLLGSLGLQLLLALRAAGAAA